MVGNSKSGKVLVTANFVGASLEFKHCEMKDIKNNDFKKKNPLGKIPVLETAHGCIYESNAIMRYLTREHKSPTLYGESTFEAGLVDQWIDFCNNELEPASIVLLF